MIRVIPAIDIIEGKCVRLAYGDFSKKVIYDENPVDVALRFQDAGIKRLHMVDLDGAKQGKVVNFKVLEKVAAKTNHVIDFGGGIKTSEDIKIAMNSGAAMFSTGSVAIKNKELLKEWIKVFGADKIIVAADVKDEKVAVAGWQEETKLYIYDCINSLIEDGIKYVMCTDISKDGSLAGPAKELYTEILKQFPKMHLIASGGISCLKDIDEVNEIGCKEVIVGKALYEGRIQLHELTRFTI
jgi:phosphoribosylformimino-5-aminoimidazole carboxamide ribotide isomerase